MRLLPPLLCHLIRPFLSSFAFTGAPTLLPGMLGAVKKKQHVNLVAPRGRTEAQQSLWP